jgi:hypothetical protein
MKTQQDITSPENNILWDDALTTVYEVEQIVFHPVFLCIRAKEGGRRWHA